MAFFMNIDSFEKVSVLTEKRRRDDEVMNEVKKDELDFLSGER